MFSKIFERLIYNAIFKDSSDNNLIPSNQSGFKLDDSCINQLIAITRNIFKGFDDVLEVRGHEGLIYKLRRNGICGNLLKLLLSFLCSRKQRAMLNGHCSSWCFIKVAPTDIQYYGRSKLSRSLVYKKNFSLM